MSTSSRSASSSTRPRLLVTDLDNTLYDWVSYFAVSFYAMVDELVAILDISRDQLLDEFQAIHRRYGNSEHPFAVLELETVQRRYAGRSREDVLAELRTATRAFNAARAEHLRLYEGVAETLAELKEEGVIVVAHTEAIVENAFFRLETLGVRETIRRLYALKASLLPHPSPNGPRYGTPPRDFVHLVPPEERKPNPRLLLDICARENVSPADTWYVGDSLTRDISMALAAGCVGVWARYGTSYSKEHWQRLVRVTHWTPDDVEREGQLKKQFANVRPSATIDSFRELLSLNLLPHQAAGSTG